MNFVNPSEIIENSKFNRFHFMLMALGALVILFDGYDLVVYGSVVPVLIKEWQLSPVQAGALGSYGLFGVMIGALVFGPLADKIGRKKVILITILFFSLFTALCGFAANPTFFAVCRFIAGLGLGGIMPNVIALTTDYAPKNMRSTLVSIVLCGYSFGGMLAPALGIQFIPRLGWESVFYFAGILLFLIPILYKCLPESISFLLAKGKTDEMRRILQQIDPSQKFSEDVKFERTDAKETGFIVSKLFSNNLGLSTILFWIAYFMCLLMIYGLNTWLPNLMMKTGYALGSSLSFLMVLNGGSIIGTLIIGRLSDKWGTKKMLVPLYILGAICLTLLGFKNNMGVLYLLVGITGACTIGAQNIANAYMPQYYPPFMRSTTLGVASGVGRVGAMIGPILGGFLLTISMPIQFNFITFAIPGVIAAIAFWFIPEKYAYYKKSINEREEAA